MRRDRLGRQARYAGYAALWLLIVIVMTAAGNGAGNHRARTSVDRITVDIDSPEGALLTEQIVREWVETEEYSPWARVSTASIWPCSKSAYRRTRP